MTSILVTGATGNVGLEIVRLLERRGVSYAAAVRGPTKSGEIPVTDA